MYEVLADGTAWQDADGREVFSYTEACTLADMLERMGYRTEVTQVCHHPEHI